MDDNRQRSDDISELWGPETNGVLEPAPPRGAQRGNQPGGQPRRRSEDRNGTGSGSQSGQPDRIGALERDLHRLIGLVAGLKSRLDLLEEQVRQVTAALPADQPEATGRVHKGMSRLSDVIKSTRSH